ncbi:MAG TPA: hypothetical protein VFE60_22865 [Roseiarcus sp.]|nr:hypothetical protein [Roseiarcus sp.]
MSCISRRASGHGASTDSPAAPPTDYAVTQRAAIERVVMSRTTIEIELAEAALLEALSHCRAKATRGLRPTDS